MAIGQGSGLEMIELDDPQIAPHEVRLRVAFCGICGSDLEMRGRSATFRSGTVLGHELSGEVTEVGSSVSGWAIGDRAAICPLLACERCELCLVGQEHLCRVAVANGIGLGIATGGLGENVVAHVDRLERLPPSVSNRAGALAEPLAVVLHGISRAQVDTSRPVAVLGAGPIGVLLALALRARGHTTVMVLERNPGRRHRVRALGFDAADASEPLTPPPAVVFDCTGNRDGVAIAAGLLAAGGCIVVLGLSAEPTPLPPRVLTSKELEIRGSVAYRRSEFAEAVQHLSAGRIPVDSVITATVPLREAERWFDDLASGTSDHVKILLEP